MNWDEGMPVKLPKEYLEKLDGIAQGRKMSRAHAARHAIDVYLNLAEREQGLGSDNGGQQVQALRADGGRPEPSELDRKIGQLEAWQHGFMVQIGAELNRLAELHPRAKSVLQEALAEIIAMNAGRP